MLKRVVGVLGIVTALLFLPRFAQALESTVADFDTGNDTSVYWGGTTWSGVYNTDGALSASRVYVSTVQHTPNSGYALEMNWSGVTSGTEEALTVITNMTSDISTYTYLSFWIYTPNANVDMGIALMDDGFDAGQIELQDYVTTEVNQWQNVSIPLKAFERNNTALNLTAVKEIKWLAHFDDGHDASGKIMVDDVKFVIAPHAPAGSTIYSGGDAGVADSDDLPGDTLLWYDGAASSDTTNLVTVKVSTAYAVSWADTPELSYEDSAGTTNYFAFQLLNLGNTADKIVFSTSLVSGSSWDTSLYWDSNSNGTYDSGTDIQWADSAGTLPETTYYFLTRIFIPNAASAGSSTTVKITAKDQNGLGANDSWGGSDTLTYDFTLGVLTGGGSNLLASFNPGFENATELEFWEEIGTASGIDESATIFHDGSDAANLKDLTAAYADRGIKGATVTVTTGNMYSARAWIAAPTTAVANSTNTYCRVRIQWFDNGGSSLGYSASTITVLGSYDTYYQIVLASQTAPASAVGARVMIDGQEYQSVHNDNNDLYIDDVEIIYAGEGEGTPSVSISKSADKTMAKPDETVTYTLTYGNSGDGAATNVTIIDNIPFGTDLNAVATESVGGESITYYHTAGGWNTTYTGAEKVKWVRASLGAGVTNQQVTFTVKVK